MDADRWPQTVVIANCGRAESALLRGDPDAAAAIVEQTRQAIFCGDLLWWPALLTLGLRAQADRADRARADGREDLAADARATAEELIGGTELQGTLRWARFERPVAAAAPPETHAHAEQGAAELQRLQGAQRSDLWAQVSAHWDELRFPYQGAYTRLRDAEARLANGGDREAVVVALQDARAALQQLGAAPLLSAVEAVAQRVGMQPSGNPDALSPPSESRSSFPGSADSPTVPAP